MFKRIKGIASRILLAGLTQNHQQRRPIRRPSFFRPMLQRLEERYCPSTPPSVPAAVPAPMPDFASKVNITEVKSGKASDPTVWNLDRPLRAGDFFSVPAGDTLTWDLTTCPKLAGGDVNGVLDCGVAPGNKVMNIATLFIDSGGSFLCGSCNTNTPLNGTFTLTFLDVAPDPIFDPGQFGTGFLAMGATVDMCGSANMTAWVWAQSIPKGTKTIHLNSVPSDWNVGDQILLPTTQTVVAPGGFVSTPQDDEVMTIASISGSTVTLAKPTKFDHLAMLGPKGQVNYVPVADLSRRIVFQSANPNGTRGHVMFMKDMMGNPTIVTACHVLVKDCGRTLGTEPVTDPMINPVTGRLIPGTADNPRARYAWHSHLQGETGPDGTSASSLQVWDSIVVWGATKFGFDNHGSNVDATNCVAYQVQGSSFATEKGSEIGTYTNCFGFRTSGGGALLGERQNDDDYGSGGVGCWLQGPGVSVIDCVFGADPEAGIVVATGQTPIVGVITNLFQNSLLPNPTWAVTNQGTPAGYSPITDIPMFGLSGNFSWGCGKEGLLLWNHNPLHFSSDYQHSDVGSSMGISLLYSNGAFVLDGALEGPNFASEAVAGYSSTGIAINRGYVSAIQLAPTIQVAGYFHGVMLPSTVNAATSIINGGYFANVHDFEFITPVLGNTCKTVFQAAPTFGTVTSAQLNGATRYNYFCDRIVGSDYASMINGVLRLYGWENIVTPMYNQSTWFQPTLLLADGRQVYAPEQASDFVPVPSTGINWPAGWPQQLVGLTNAQLWAKFGIALGGTLAPVTTANTDPSTNGLIGPAATYPPGWYMTSSDAPYSATASLTIAPNPGVAGSPSTIAVQDPQSGFNLFTVTTPSGNKTSYIVLEPTIPPPLPPATDQFNDPGFKLPNVSTGSYGYIYDPESPAWTYSGGSGVSTNGTAFTAGNPNAPQGTQVAFIQGTGTISQEVNFTFGSFTISGLAAQRANVTSSQTFEVEIDGVVAGTFKPAGTSYSSFITHRFKVTTGLHTVSFVGINPLGGDNTIFLDNVSIA